MNGYRTEKCDGGCRSDDGKRLCAFHKRTCDIYKCRGIIFTKIKIKRKAAKPRGGKVLAIGWWALLNRNGDVESVHSENCYQCDDKYLLRVDIVKARAK